VSERRLYLALFLGALCACALVTKSSAVSWNDRSRFATIESLVDRGTFAIDRSPFADTKDEYRYRGRLYSDKSPLLQLEGAAAAEAVRVFGISLGRAQGAAIYLTTLLTIGPWFALGIVYAYAFQRDLGFDRRIALAVALATGFATLGFPYAAVFSNPVPTGVASLAAIFHLRRASDRRVDAVLGGLFLAVAFAFDAGSVTVFLAALFVLLPVRPLSTIALAIAAIVPLVGLQLAYNRNVSTGFGPPALNQATWSDPHSPFYLAHPTVLRLAGPAAYAGYGVALLVGNQGLFSYSPLMLASLAGFVAMWRSDVPEKRVLAFAIAVSSIVYAALVWLQTQDFASSTYGDRRWVAISYLLCVPLGEVFLAARTSRIGRIALAALVAVSAAIAVLGTVAPFAPPPGIVYAWDALLNRTPLLRALDGAGAALLILVLLTTSWKATAPTPDTWRLAARISR